MMSSAPSSPTPSTVLASSHAFVQHSSTLPAISPQQHTPYLPFDHGHHVLLNPPPAPSATDQIHTVSYPSPYLNNNYVLSATAHQSSPALFAAPNNDAPPISSPNTSLRTPSHRPLPTSLPATPRLPSGSTPSRQLPSVSPSIPLSRLRSSYVNMLNQKSSSHKRSPTSMPPPPPPAPRNNMVDTLEGISNFLDEALVSPSLADSNTFGGGAGPYSNGGDVSDLLAYLSSPTSPFFQQPLHSFGTPASAMLTSPQLDDDINRILATPASALTQSSMGFSPVSPSVYSTSPQFEMWDVGMNIPVTNAPLFNDETMVPPPVQAKAQAPTALGLTTTTPNMSRVSSSGSGSSNGVSRSSYPPTPALESDRRPSISRSVQPSSLTAPSPSLSSSSYPHSHPPPTGHRRNVQPKDLVPLDAPTQPRSYVTPSATSRKDIPVSVARTFVPSTPGPRKRNASQAGLTTPEELHDASEADGVPYQEETLASLGIESTGDPLLDHIALKRRQNTLAARKSRQRKLEHARLMDDKVDKLTQERDEWRMMADKYRAQCEQLEQELRNAGLRR